MQDKFINFLGLVKKSGNLIEGYNKCEEAVVQKRIYLIIMSSDCSENTKDKFIRYCSKYNVPYINYYSKESLGEPLGRDEINILGISDKNMSLKLISLWKEKTINFGGEDIVKN